MDRPLRPGESPAGIERYELQGSVPHTPPLTGKMLSRGFGVDQIIHNSFGARGIGSDRNCWEKWMWDGIAPARFAQCAIVPLS